MQRQQKIQNLFGMSVNPTVPTSMLMVTLRQILLKKKKLLIIQMGLSKKETLLVNNDEITKTLNEHFAETAEILNTSELTFSRSLVVSGC